MVVAVLAALAPVAGAAPPERRPAGLALVDARACSSPTAWTARGPLAIAAGVDGTGGCAALRLRLDRAAELEFLVLQRKPRPRVVHRERRRARAGLTTVVWRPAPGSEPRTYVTQLRIRGTSDRSWLPGPVIRIRGTTARFAQERAQPGRRGVARRRRRAGRRDGRRRRSGDGAGRRRPEAAARADAAAAGRLVGAGRLRRPDPNTKRDGRPRAAGRRRAAVVAPTRRRRPPDEHVAGVQPARRGRGRVGRQLVRDRPARERAARPSVHGRRPAAVLRPLRPAVPALVPEDGAQRRLPHRRGPRPGAVGGRPRAALRPRRPARPPRVRDPSTSSTSSRASATGAATSRS